jgi:hypothetical protein
LGFPSQHFLKGRRLNSLGWKSILKKSIPVGALLLGLIGQCFILQWQKPWTLFPGLVFYLFALVFYQALVPAPREGFTSKTWTPARESAAFLSVFGLALFFRVYHIASVPSGSCVDSVEIGLGGLRVLHEGWRPFAPTDFCLFPGLVFYYSAAWFKFFTPSQASLSLFFVALSLCAFPFIYWTFRELAGPPTALVTAFFLAVARWDVSYSRWCIAAHVSLYVFGTTAFLLYGLRRGKTWAFALSAGFFSLGFYTYDSFKIFPFLLAAYLFYEYRSDGNRFRRQASKLLFFPLLFLLVDGPLVFYWLGQQNGGQSYEMSLLIWNKIKSEGSLAPLFKNIVETVLMFNRKGDDFSMHNYLSHRMLDDGMGILFVFGLFFALPRFRQRPFFYALAGLGVFSLNCLLTVNPAQANRMLGTLPFAAFLAANALLTVLKDMAGRNHPGQGVLKWGLAIILPLVAVQNFHQYFDEQASDPGAKRCFDMDSNDIARSVAQDGQTYDYYLTPRYGDHNVIRFLDYSRQKDFKTMDWPKDLAPVSVSEGKKGICFVLAEGETGILHLLQKLFPAAVLEIHQDPDGLPMVYYLRLDKEAILNSRGVYQVTGTRKIPFPHFPGGLLPESPAVFSGNFFVDQSGYFRCPKRAGWSPWVDGRRVEFEKWFWLDRGFHALRLRFTGGKQKEEAPVFVLAAETGPPLSWNQSSLTTLDLCRGLRAEYKPSWEAKEVLYTEWDPILNFSYRNSFAVKNPPLVIRWGGDLEVPQGGIYHLMALTNSTNLARIWIDGKPLSELEDSPESETKLDPGKHGLRVDFEMGTGFFSSLHLAWKRPGQTKFEIIPSEYFGLSH